MDKLRMFVNGQAMSGGSLNLALKGATFLGPARTAPAYRFFSVRDEFPGLYPVSSGGCSIPGELYELPWQTLHRELLPKEPHELELAIITLDDGTGSLSMRLRDAFVGAEGVTDISDRGGWRAYLDSGR